MFWVIALAAWLTAGDGRAGLQQPAQPATVVQPEGMLPLPEVLARVRSRSPLIEAARQRMHASVRARQALPRSPNPFVELRGENLGTTDPSRLPRDVFATVSLPLELGGERAARTAHADASRISASAEVTTTEWALILEVSELYIEALRAREGMSTLVEQRESVASIVTRLAERVSEGVAAEADLRRFDAEHARLASQAARASIAMRLALQRLSAAVGEEVRPQQLMMPLPAAPVAPPPGPPEASIERRADVRTAAARLQRAEATAALERARAVPDLTFTAGYKRTSGFDTAVAGVTLPIAIFDRNQTAVANTAGEVSAARLELEYARRQALADAQARSAAALELGAHAARAASDLLGPAGIVRSAARAAFVEGSGDVLQLVDAERVYGDAAREALDLQLDATLAVITARLALGEPPFPD